MASLFLPTEVPISYTVWHWHLAWLAVWPHGSLSYHTLWVKWEHRKTEAGRKCNCNDLILQISSKTTVWNKSTSTSYFSFPTVCMVEGFLAESVSLLKYYHVSQKIKTSAGLTLCPCPWNNACQSINNPSISAHSCDLRVHAPHMGILVKHPLLFPWSSWHQWFICFSMRKPPLSSLYRTHWVAGCISVWTLGLPSDQPSALQSLGDGLSLSDGLSQQSPSCQSNRGQSIIKRNKEVLTKY